MDYLRLYESHVREPIHTTQGDLRPGDIIQFHHHNDYRIGIVIAPNYQGKLGVASMKMLPIEVVQRMIMEAANFRYPSKDTIDRNAQALYTFYRDFLTTYDAYRTYNWANISRLEKVTLSFTRKTENDNEEIEEAVENVIDKK
jgi:hypothetical protein